VCARTRLPTHTKPHVLSSHMLLGARKSAVGGRSSAMSEESRIRTFSDYVFGLVVVFSAFSLTNSIIQTPIDLVSSMALFALSFAILISVAPI